ncbi:hypothetical protein [Aeromicrobium alkaliterrae]|uniref:hypothetical protein n=1 Tax=Aeromicrobium alkaliterrae TaxID=302168 RepID=UPI0031D0946C
MTDLATAPFLSSRRTRNKVSDEDRARLVAWYVAQVAGGDRNPARTLADRYPDSSFKTWANIFSRARTEQPVLLTAAPRRGVAGGVLTDHAERLLGFSSDVPDELVEVYQAEREEHAASVRYDKRVKPPRRSRFSTDAEYEATFDLWAQRRVWFIEVEVGDATFEDFEDWWNRVARSPSNPQKSGDRTGTRGHLRLVEKPEVAAK